VARERRVDQAFGAVLAVAGVVIARSAAALPTIPAQAYGPGFFPMWVGIALAVCGVLIAGRTWLGGEWRTASPVASPVTPASCASSSGGRSWRAWLAMSWMVLGLGAVALFLETVGFLLCMPVFMLGYLWLAGEPLRRSALTTAVAMALVYWGFARLLRVPLPQGWLEGVF
jgi:putative tricarboxylic transport membrane protein